MPRAHARSLLATIAVAAVLVYGLAGHGLSQMGGHDELAGAAAGLCMLLVAALGCTARVKPQACGTVVVLHRLPTGEAPPPHPAVDASARASPALLQRFRN